MNARLSASLAVLGTAVGDLSAATDAELDRLASIEEQLRNSDGLSNDETNALAVQISAITGSITRSTIRLTDSLSDVHDAAGTSDGSITSSTARLTNSLSDVHQAAGTSDGSQIAQGSGDGSGGTSTAQSVGSGGSESGGVAGSAGSPTPTDQEQGGSGQQEQGGEQPQDPAPQTEG